MRPLIGHETIKFCARVLTAMTAEINISVPGALSEFALFYPIIDIVAETTITVCCSACPAKETTGATFQGFHNDPMKQMIILVRLFQAKSARNP